MMITVYFKSSKTHVVQTEIHPLGSNNWFSTNQDMYMKEIEIMLHDAIISKTLEGVQGKRNKKKTSQSCVRKMTSKPIQLNGTMLRIAYSFETRSKCMDYVLMTNYSRQLSTNVCSAYEFLNEKLVVYAMPLEEFRQTLTISKKSHPVLFKDAKENHTIAISDYFENEAKSKSNADHQKERLKAMLKKSKKKKKILASGNNIATTLKNSSISNEQLTSNNVNLQDFSSLDTEDVQENERSTGIKFNMGIHFSPYRGCDNQENSVSCRTSDVNGSKTVNRECPLLLSSEFDSSALVQNKPINNKDSRNENKVINPVRLDKSCTAMTANIYNSREEIEVRNPDILKKSGHSKRGNICNSRDNDIYLDDNSVQLKCDPSHNTKQTSRKREFDMFKSYIPDPDSKKQCYANDHISPVMVGKGLSPQKIIERDIKLQPKHHAETKKTKKFLECESNESFEIHSRSRKESKRKYGLEMSSEDEDFAPLRRKPRKKAKSKIDESSNLKVLKTNDMHETTIKKLKTSTKRKKLLKCESAQNHNASEAVPVIKTNTGKIDGVTLLKAKQTELFLEKCKQKLNETITKFKCDRGDSADAQKHVSKSNGDSDCVLTYVDKKDIKSKRSSEENQDPEDIFSDCFIMEELSTCYWTPGKVNANTEEEISEIKAVCDLNEKQLQYIVNKNEHYLRQIFQGKMKNKRHDEYKKGGKARANLMYQINIGLFKENQHDAVMEALIGMFCKRHNKYFDYIIKVMLPEILIKIYMDINGVSHEETETVMNKALNTMGAIFV